MQLTQQTKHSDKLRAFTGRVGTSKQESTAQALYSQLRHPLSSRLPAPHASAPASSVCFLLSTSSSSSTNWPQIASSRSLALTGLLM